MYFFITVTQSVIDACFIQNFFLSNPGGKHWILLLQRNFFFFCTYIDKNIKFAGFRLIAARKPVAKNWKAKKHFNCEKLHQLLSLREGTGVSQFNWQEGSNRKIVLSLGRITDPK